MQPLEIQTGVQEKSAVFWNLCARRAAAFPRIFCSLNALQHRGRNHGIAVLDTTWGLRGWSSHPQGAGAGLMVFAGNPQNSDRGTSGIGHVRYTYRCAVPELTNDKIAYQGDSSGSQRKPCQMQRTLAFHESYGRDRTIFRHCVSSGLAFYITKGNFSALPPWKGSHPCKIRREAWSGHLGDPKLIGVTVPSD